MHFELTEEQTLLENMVTAFVRDDYNWETREKLSRLKKAGSLRIGPSLPN